nr:MAG TPA: Protein of unknown function (DUF3930) [Caudoviricetes sp.]
MTIIGCPYFFYARTKGVDYVRKQIPVRSD